MRVTNSINKMIVINKIIEIDLNELNSFLS